MAYNATIRDKIFQRLGFFVKWWYELQASKDTVMDLQEEGVDTFLPAGHNDLDETIYGGITQDVEGQDEQLESMRQGVVSAASSFLTEYVKDQLDVPYSTAEEVLEYLVDQMGASYPPDTVLENIPSEGVFERDADSSVQEGDLPEFDATQLARDNQHFSLVCVDDSQIDEERWTISSDGQGEFGSEVVTEELADWTEAGITNLLVPAAPAHGEDDLSDKVDGWNFSGATRGTHTDADGRVYLKFSEAPAVAEANDDLSQLSGWTVSTAVFGEESDPEGLLHISMVKSPSAYEVTGGTQASLDASSIILDDSYFDQTRMNRGKLYVRVKKETGAPANSKYTVELYADAARTDLMASGYEDDVEDTEFPLEIDLQNGGTTYGKVTLDSFDSAVNCNDDTIVIGVPRYFVQAYRDSGRGASDLVAEGVSTSPSAASLLLASAVAVGGDLSPDVAGTFHADGTYNGAMSYTTGRHYLWYDSTGTQWYISETKGTAGSDYWVKSGADLAGSYSPQGSCTGTATVTDPAFTTELTVDLQYVQDDEDITLAPAFATVAVYRADPDDPDTTESDIVARAGSTTDLLTESATDLAFYAVGGSSLESATVDLSAEDVSDGYVASAVLGYASGDQFIFETNTVDDGRFQTFVRENYNQLLPSSPYPTIPESWAGATS